VGKGGFTSVNAKTSKVEQEQTKELVVPGLIEELRKLDKILPAIVKAKESVTESPKDPAGEAEVAKNKAKRKSSTCAFGGVGHRPLF
jgi:hypothetical protein